VSAALAALDSPADELATLTLQAEGYHRHRGEWRRRRTCGSRR
jgi:hypothetical protein